jgi:hypothetical protein
LHGIKQVAKQGRRLAGIDRFPSQRTVERRKAAQTLTDLVLLLRNGNQNRSSPLTDTHFSTWLSTAAADNSRATSLGALVFEEVADGLGAGSLSGCHDLGPGWAEASTA